MVASRNSLSPSDTGYPALLPQQGLDQHGPDWQPHSESALLGPPLEHKPARRGFTLTELLVVITIIAVLASLTSVAVMRAMDTAKQTRIKVEVDGLDLAFKAYKEKYGSYPPCDLRSGNIAAIRAHVARAFPRYDLTTLANDLTQAGLDTVNFRPDQALVFWLSGFSPDPANPFVSANGFQIQSGATTTTPVIRTKFFDFDKSRLLPDPSTVAGSPKPLPTYFPQGVPAAPYLYFDAFSYGTAPTVPAPTAVPLAFNGGGTPIYPNAGIAVAYWADSNGNGIADIPPAENWANPDSFQIIATGMDGKYGNPAGTTARLFPTGTGYDLPAPTGNLADDDNVTNFNAKARLADAKP